MRAVPLIVFLGFLLQGFCFAAPASEDKTHDASGVPEILWPMCGGELSVQQLQDKAEKGDPLAKAQMGYRLLNTRELSPNPEQAFQLFKQAAAANVPLGHSGLSSCYSNGFGCQPNDKLRYKYASQAAKAGLSWGVYQLGMCFADGKGVDRDVQRADELFRQAAEAGDPFAQRWIANRELKNPNTRKDAMVVIKELAARDLPVAHLDLGRDLIRRGKRAEGMAHLEKSARLGLTFGMAHYGTELINDGEVVEGTDWIMESIDRGSSHGYSNLGLMLYNSSDKAPDAADYPISGSSEAAFHFLKRAEETGSNDYNGIGALAVHYAWGRGTRKNDKEASRLIEKAWRLYDQRGGKHNCKLAMYSSKVYWVMKPPRKDLNKAIAYELSVQHTETSSLNRLAWYYSMKKHKQSYDPVRGWAVILVCRKKNINNAYVDGAVKRLEGKLSPEQIKMAEALVDRGFPEAQEFKREGLDYLGRER